MWGPTRSCSSAATSTNIYGINRTGTCSRVDPMAQSLSFVRRERADLIAAPISAFESETQAVIQRTTPYSEHAILYVLTGMIVLSLILMSVVKLDRVVSA